MYTVDNIADFFLSKESIYPKKLQKLVYYSYAWSIALLNDSPENIQFKLFESDVEAWVHGPVVPELYRKYKDFGWQEIPQVKDFDESIFASEILDILQQVWDVYGGFTGNQLEAISHKEMPWIEARKGIPVCMASSEIISDKNMFIYYNEQANY